MEDATVHEARLLLGRYRVERVLGGGMGVVYVAQDTHFDRKVAVKTIRPALAPDATQARELLLRFEREKVAHERVGNHPNLVTVYDFAIYRDPEPAPYLILEYVAGGALSDRLQQGPIPLDIALRYTADTVRGLGVAHAKQIVHRDIKPGNIFLATDGRAEVGDFGIAQVGDLSGRDDDATRRHPGTPLYMSPEQETKPGYLRPTSDQYSVGLVLFEMLTCELYKQLSLRQLEERLAAMPPAVAALIRRMTAADPEARYESMAQVHREIVAVYRSLQLAPPEDDYSTQMVFQASPQQWETPPSGSGSRATPPGVPSSRQTPRLSEPTAVDVTPQLPGQQSGQNAGQPRSTPLVNLQPAAPAAPPTSVDKAASADATQVDDPGVQGGQPASGRANPSTDSLAEMQRQIMELRQQMADDEQRRTKDEAAARRRKQVEEEEARRQESERVARQLREVAEQQRRNEEAEKERQRVLAERGPVQYPPPTGAAPPIYPHVSATPPLYPPVYPPIYPAIPPKKKGSFGRRAFLLLLLGGGGGTAGYFAYRKGTEIAATRTPSPGIASPTTRPATVPATTTTFLTPPGVTAPPLGSRTTQTPTSTSRPATATVTRLPSTATPIAKPIYQANLANWYIGKGITDKSDFSYDSATREYHIANRNTNNMVYIFNPEKQIYADCVIEADVRGHSGGNGAGFGILLRGGMAQGLTFPLYNAFLISPLGFWAIWASDGGGTMKSITADAWNPSSSIKMGDVVNRLTVICEGTQLTLMINGTFVGGPYEAVRTDGTFGLGVISGSETPTISADGYFTSLRVSSVS